MTWTEIKKKRKRRLSGMATGVLLPVAIFLEELKDKNASEVSVCRPIDRTETLMQLRER